MLLDTRRKRCYLTWAGVFRGAAWISLAIFVFFLAAYTQNFAYARCHTRLHTHIYITAHMTRTSCYKMISCIWICSYVVYLSICSYAWHQRDIHITLVKPKRYSHHFGQTQEVFTSLWSNPRGIHITLAHHFSSTKDVFTASQSWFAH